ncbi:type I-E CRISPR-associated protein Cse2/CasB [Brooklawnia cerclae]|uniref:CRISPR system Cascade subunit CasB n=1 Tax=Brooklawnia cerclae TaxID=349934 RepID=A0ABX0SLR3_9ACTN|nr:type I-E CRISPR-associated protein Cse2/CasB [Brooklawnia cerclae]NIH57667.1 CRISPR system Cascade subunit CasB [Brooklawnia cerclae]
MTTVTSPIPDRRRPGESSQLLAAYVGRRATQLQSRYLAQDPRARADLARLRRAVGRSPGSDPAAWDVIFRDFPPELMGRNDAPSPAELAVNAALCLFGVHLQSADKPMHVQDQGLGRAVRLLSRPEDTETFSAPTMRRFHALGTATSLVEVLHHARGLIQQFRAGGIGLDYGRLADDFYWLQRPASADNVRLRWARDLYRIDPQTENSPEKEISE